MNDTERKPAILRVATWNIHGCMGTDGKVQPLRIARVLRELAPDIVGLQEVNGVAAGLPAGGQLHELAALTQLLPTPGPARYYESGSFGNAVLTKHAVAQVVHTDLSVVGREERSMLDVVVQVPNALVRVIITHFGLRARERRQQTDKLIELARRVPELPLIVLGDFNEWHPKSTTLLALHAAFGRTPHVRSFPSWCPVLGLDRIWVYPRTALIDLSAHHLGRRARASDHLPVLATLDLARLAAVPGEMQQVPLAHPLPQLENSVEIIQRR